MKSKLFTKNKWNRLSIAGLCLLFLGTFASQAVAQTDEVTSDTLDYSAYAHSYDSVWLEVSISWDYEGCLSCDDDHSTSTGVLISVNGNVLTAYMGGDPGYHLNTGDFPVLVPDSDLTSPMIVTREYWNSEITDYGTQYWWGGVGTLDIATYLGGKGMALSRSPISLGQVRVGSHKGDTLKLSSIGGDPITVSSSIQTGTLFSRYPTTSNRTIAAGSTELDRVIFAPTARGTFSDSLIFTTNSTTLSEQRMGVY